MKPYYENENGKLYHEDYKNVTKGIGKVDCIITSPPYNMNLRIRDGKYCSRQIVKEISTKYESFDDNLTMDEYLEFSKSVINRCLQISDMVFYNVQFLTGNKKALFKLIGLYSEYLKEIIIWDKVTAQPAIGQNILNSQFEVILVFESDPLKSNSRSFSNGRFDRGTLSNIWKIKRGKKICKDHGAVFPEELVEKIINNFTDPGQVIFDPFSGTGTTASVCNRLDRKWIGSELSEKYCEIAAKRIEEENRQLKLF